MAMCPLWRFPFLPGRAHWGAAPRLANTLTNPAATDPGHRQLAAGNQRAMSAGSLRVATYMQEHPDDAAEIRDQLKFWNQVMDHQVPMTKERVEETLPLLTALEWGPLFTNTSPIMFCPLGLDPLDVRCSFPTAEPSSHLHAARAADEHRPRQPVNLVRLDPKPDFSLAQPYPPVNSLVFPIRHCLPSPTDTAWTHRLNMTPPKPSPTLTDVNMDYSVPLCPPEAHLTDPPYNRFNGLNSTDVTAHAAIQPIPHLLPIQRLRSPTRHGHTG
ncbi:hypothetical protein DYB26_013162 [Aphanomyces astaci]|uniref:Uncharacterized protein n=1 Tax=Aphanomyces astaci TaxID=112090 RepID=A0A397EPE2_APHAT|nr:hypothetical protein DYB31_003591 [Aphanomyces astaci]RHZ09327.1 hypothetical protein DYB26_013162 [Aphanomyces astaci]